MIDKPFIVFGEALWDVFPDGKKLGGAPLNFTYYFSRAGGHPVLISALGDDQNGAAAMLEIKKRGIRTDFIQINERPTGTVAIKIKGQTPRFNIARDTAWEAITYPDNFSVLKKAYGLYLGTLSRISRQNQTVLDRLIYEFKDRIKFMDINLRQKFFSRDDIEFLLHRVDYLKLNGKEVRILKNMDLARGKTMEQVAGFLVRQYNMKACCVTLGERGAVAGDRDGNLRLKAVPAGSGGDAVGAGDAFGAFWLAELLKGSNLKFSVGSKSYLLISSWIITSNSLS